MPMAAHHTRSLPQTHTHKDSLSFSISIACPFVFTSIPTHTAIHVHVMAISPSSLGYNIATESQFFNNDLL